MEQEAEKEEFPLLCERRSPELCIPAERADRDRPQPKPGPNASYTKVKKGGKVAPCATFFFFFF